MTHLRRMLVRSIIGLATWSLGGCGGEARRLVRVDVLGTLDGHAPRLEKGRVELGDDIELYDVSMRVEGVRVRTDAGVLGGQGPVSADLLAGTILLEQQTEATRLLGVELDVAHGGGGEIAPGYPAGVLVAGFIREVQLDYRDAAMETIELEAPIDLEQSARVEVRFALDAWFATISSEALELVEGRYVIDEQLGANSAAAAAIEAAIRGSATVGASPTQTYPDDDIESEDELEVELER